MSRYASSCCSSSAVHFAPTRPGGTAALTCAVTSDVAFQQLQRGPVRRVPGARAAGQHRDQLVEHRLVLGADGRAVRLEGGRVARQVDRRVDQLADALVSRGDQADDRDAERGLEHVRLDVDAVLLGHVAHVQPDDQRGVERQQLRDQVQAALERGRVDDRDRDVGPLADQVVARDALFLRVGGQAVGAGQVDQVDRWRRRSWKMPVFCSTVLPGQFPTCWLSPVSMLKTVDLPTLGWPTSANGERVGQRERRRARCRGRKAGRAGGWAVGRERGPDEAAG